MFNIMYITLQKHTRDTMTEIIICNRDYGQYFTRTTPIMSVKKKNRMNKTRTLNERQ